MAIGNKHTAKTIRNNCGSSTAKIELVILPDIDPIMVVVAISNPVRYSVRPFCREYAIVDERAVKIIINNAVPIANASPIPKIINEGVVIKPPPTPRAEDIIPTKKAKITESKPPKGSVIIGSPIN
jgi:hypothetical protein